MREIRWRCDDKGCYRKLMPRLGAFDGCFDGKIGMSDVDGIVEVDGHFLLLEWKAPGGYLSTGQRIMFERITALSRRWTVLVVTGNPEEMTAETLQVIHGGKVGQAEACDFRSLLARVFAWNERAKIEGIERTA